MTGTDLSMMPPAAPAVAGEAAERRPEVYTNAVSDTDLLAVWLKAHADGSAHTQRAYSRIGARFLNALGATGADLRGASLDDIQAALEALRVKPDGTATRAATLNTYVAAVKSLLGFAQRVGFTRFNAAPLIKLKRAPRRLAEKLLPEVEVQLLIRAAKPGRDRLMMEVAYYGALRASELVGLTWGQIIPRDSGEAQLAIVGKGDKARNVLLPVDVAKFLFSIRGRAASSDLVFQITARRFDYIVRATARRAGLDRVPSPHWLRHAHASHAIDNGAPISLVSQTLGHADLKTTSIYAHAKPGDSSSRYLKR